MQLYTGIVPAQENQGIAEHRLIYRAHLVLQGLLG